MLPSGVADASGLADIGMFDIAPWSLPGLAPMSIDDVLPGADALGAVASSGNASSSAASNAGRRETDEVLRRCMLMTPPPRGTCPPPCDTSDGSGTPSCQDCRPIRHS